MVLVQREFDFFKDLKGIYLRFGYVPFFIREKAMVKCKDCKYWTRYEGENQRFGKCENSKIEYGSENTYGQLYYTDDQLLYEDYEQYNASFCTGQNFGCIHGIEKQEKCKVPPIAPEVRIIKEGRDKPSKNK